MTSEVEVRSQWIRLGDDGILYVKAEPGAEIDRDEAEASVHAARQLSNQPRPALVDLSNLKGMTREARVYYAGPETAKGRSALALLIKSPVARVFGNFFMGLNKTTVPTRLFTSEPEAIAWLRGFLV